MILCEISNLLGFIQLRLIFLTTVRVSDTIFVPCRKLDFFAWEFSNQPCPRDRVMYIKEQRITNSDIDITDRFSECPDTGISNKSCSIRIPSNYTHTRHSNLAVLCNRRRTCEITKDTIKAISDVFQDNCSKMSIDRHKIKVSVSYECLPESVKFDVCTNQSLLVSGSEFLYIPSQEHIGTCQCEINGSISSIRILEQISTRIVIKSGNASEYDVENKYDKLLTLPEQLYSLEVISNTAGYIWIELNGSIFEVSCFPTSNFSYIVEQSSYTVQHSTPDNIQRNILTTKDDTKRENDAQHEEIHAVFIVVGACLVLCVPVILFTYRHSRKKTGNIVAGLKHRLDTIQNAGGSTADILREDNTNAYAEVHLVNDIYNTTVSSGRINSTEHHDIYRLHELANKELVSNVYTDHKSVQTSDSLKL